LPKGPRKGACRNPGVSLADLPSLAPGGRAAVTRRLLDAGVDAVITVRPDLLLEVLVSRDQEAPMLSPRESAADR